MHDDLALSDNAATDLTTQQPVSFSSIRGYVPLPRCACGQHIDFDNIVTSAMAHVGLTPRERDVCTLLLKGFATKDMLTILGNTEKTIKGRIATIFNKFDVHSRAELFNAVFPL